MDKTNGMVKGGQRLEQDEQLKVEREKLDDIRVELFEFLKEKLDDIGVGLFEFLQVRINDSEKFEQLKQKLTDDEVKHLMNITFINHDILIHLNILIEGKKPWKLLIEGKKPWNQMVYYWCEAIEDECIVASDSGKPPNCEKCDRPILYREWKEGQTVEGTWIIGQTGGYLCSICGHGRMSNKYSTCPSCGNNMKVD